MASQVYSDAVTLTSAAEFNRFDIAAYPLMTGVAGTNTVTATGPANYSLTAGLPSVFLVPVATNTGAVTLAITPSGGSALTAKNVFWNGAALTGGELLIGATYRIYYDGTQYQIIGSSGAMPLAQNSQSTAYTTVMADRGKHILHPTADNSARTFTIDSNANVPYPVGTMITFVNQINTVTISITADTLTLAGAGTTGNRTLAANGVATALKIASTSWIINGEGLS